MSRKWATPPSSTIMVSRRRRCPTCRRDQNSPAPAWMRCVTNKLRLFHTAAMLTPAPNPHLCFAKILFALRMARFPAATAGPSRLSLHPRAPRIYPGGTPTRYTCIYKGWRNADVFATLGCFGLGSPIVPVVQSSQSHMRKDVT